MAEVRVTITETQIEDRLRDLYGRVRPASIHKALSRSISQLVTEHLFAYDREHPNKLGGKRTHFYGEAARSVTSKFDESSATVQIDKVGLRQRWQGGEIRPKQKRLLTIPAIAEAHGKVSGQFQDLTLIIFPRASAESDAAVGALVEADRTEIRKSRRKKGGFAAKRERGGRVVFWLHRFVRQDPDPDVLPTEQQIARRATETVNLMLSEWLGQKGGV